MKMETSSENLVDATCIVPREEDQRQTSWD